jgi:hypothetical protein
MKNLHDGQFDSDPPPSYDTKSTGNKRIQQTEELHQKIKTFVHHKTPYQEDENITHSKRQRTANHIPDRRLIYRVYVKLLQFNIKTQSKTTVKSRALVAGAYNPSYSGGVAEIRRIKVEASHGVNGLGNPIWKIPNQKNWLAEWCKWQSTCLANMRS